MEKNYILFCYQAISSQVLAATTKPNVLRKRAKEFVEDLEDELGIGKLALWIEVYDSETAEMIDLIEIDKSTDIDSLVL